MSARSRSLFDDEDDDERASPASPAPRQPAHRPSAPSASTAAAADAPPAASDPSLTLEQAAAITTRHVSVALSAGAGCGKTFVLTRRFLSHLDPATERVALTQLVAITFTDKAAREMRDRIRAASHERLRQSSETDAAYWQEVLRGLDQARISTIHSFCANLLRSAAVEAGIDPGFSVLDEAVSQALRTRAVREVMNEDLVSNQSERDAFTLAARHGLSVARQHLLDLLKQRARLEGRGLPVRTAAEWIECWQQHARTFTIPAAIREFRDSEAVARLARLMSHPALQHHKLLPKFEAIREMFDNSWSDDPRPYLSTIHEHARMPGGRQNWPDVAVKDELKDTFEAVRDTAKELIDFCELLDDESELAEQADDTIRFGRLMSLAERRYAALKRELSALDNDDLPLLAMQLLRDHAEVRQRFAQGIRLLMVDEFQDTDPVAAQLVRDLCAGQLTEGKLFLVGDVKQSIYRFRRADPTVFRRLRQELPEAGRLPLSMNFRSRPAVLNFVNSIFAPAMGETYEPLRPGLNEHPAIADEPAIEFLIVGPQHLPEGAGKATAQQQRATEADWIARRVAQLLADERPLVAQRDGSARRVQAGDIVILLRAMTHAPEYESALRKYQIEYYLVGGRTFFAQQEVYDVYNLVRFLHEPGDEIALLGLLRSPFFSLPDDVLDFLHEPGQSLLSALRNSSRWDQLPEAPRLQRTFRTIEHLLAMKNHWSIAETLRWTIRETGFDAALLAEFLGSRKLANLEKLIGLAEQFDANDTTTLADFAERLTESIGEEEKEAVAATLPEAGDVVRIMTIHQSKGLEFPIVLVAAMNTQRKGSGGGSSLSPALGALISPSRQFRDKTKHLALELVKRDEAPEARAELLRLLYVAMTRAADKLLLCGSLTFKGEVESDWLNAIATIYDLQTGLPRNDPYLGSFGGPTLERATIPLVRVHHAAPELPASSPSARQTVRLTEAAELSTNSPPDVWPPSAVPVDPDPFAKTWFSVSQLEAALPLPVPHGAGAGNTEYVSLDDASALGQLVHAVLERLDLQRPSEWRELLEQLSSTFEGLTPQTVAAAGDMLNQFAKSPFVSELASARTIYREVDFLWRTDVTPTPASDPRSPTTVTISGQIDLLWQSADGEWGIADYKTGQFPRQEPSDRLVGPYLLQFGLYTAAAERWLGEPVSRIELIALRPAVRVISAASGLPKGAELQLLINRALQGLRDGKPLASISSELKPSLTSRDPPAG